MTDKEHPSQEINLGIKPRKLDSDQPGDIPDFARDQDEPFVLSIDDIALIGIRRQTSLAPDQEIGGVLVGQHFAKDKTIVVHIKGYLPLPSGNSSAVHFDFDHGALLQMRTQLQKLKGQDYVVGWYHSHVGSIKAFMSKHDINLHNLYFNQAWYVSCVVSGGELGLPVQFWRISDGQLLEIDEHLVKMTKAASYAEQSQRFLVPPKNVVPPSFPLTYLTDLGYDREHPFYRALLELQQTQNELNPTHVFSLELFKNILETALRIAAKSALKSELKSLIKKIEGLRSLDNSASIIFYSSAVLDCIAVLGDTAYSISVGDHKLIVCDFISNKYIVLDLPRKVTPLDIEIKDNAIWMLVSTVTNNFALLKIAIPSTGFQENEPSHFFSQAFALDVSSSPIKLLSFRDELWLHCANGIYGIEKTLLNKDTTSISLSPTNVPSKAFERCVWVKGSDGVFISNDSGELKTISTDGVVKQRVRFPHPFKDATVIDACNSADGIYTIVDSHDRRTLLLIDKSTLEIRWQFLSSSQDNKFNLHSLAIDTSTNKVFLRLGEFIVLLTDTGSSSPLWYFSKNIKNTSTVYFITGENFNYKWKEK